MMHLNTVVQEEAEDEAVTQRGGVIVDPDKPKKTEK